MSMNLWILDSQGQAVRGGSEIRGREGSIEVLRVNHGVHLPYDSDTATIQGTRKHAALSIVKNLDQSSPFLAKACCNGMNLKEVKMDIYEINKAGQEKPLYRYVLHNAKVVSLQPIFTQSQTSSSPYLETVNFIYEKITWLYLNGNYSYTDTWKER